MIVCPHCGKSVPPQMRFCPHCGGQIDVDFEQIRHKLAAEKRREEAMEKERRARKFLITSIFIFIAALSLLLAVPRSIPNLCAYPVYYAPPQKSAFDAANWLIKDPAEIPRGQNSILSVPLD
ncbi:MAG: hypothetical protein DRP82_02960 [Planctomycetota bacterium]|nr:MAG: hypothetical protein DRP82_02960 [Planctomycetota bacterium]